ncbi:uncharacterized protein LOC109142178 [Larimichthys crocea]|uniref:uncharacterized protein LOC109142178 n=1 Tax=Larimichthys crocea TaxID=215358 RepID=UPI000F5DF8B8|nr:uncharacterized protein LOC109142178 [Larimichthys crocea]
MMHRMSFHHHHLPYPRHMDRYLQKSRNRMRALHLEEPDLKSHTRTGVKYQPDLADSTTMVMPQPTNSFHPSLLHPNYNMPMVEYPGPTGPIRVHRGWTDPDMMEAGKQLPSLESGGYRFGEELVSFCKNWSPTSHELRRLLKKRLTSDQFQRITTDLDGDYHQEQSEWRAAGEYERWVVGVSKAIERAFPQKVCMTTIQQCTQKKEESTEDYYHRLSGVFEQYCGIPKPNNMDRENYETVYESHLKSCFLSGLRPSVQSSCIGWKDQRLKEIRRHAKHAEERQTEERDKELEKRELTQYNASLTMMQSIVDQHAGRGPNRGRGGRGRGGKRGRGGGRGQTQEKNATHDQDKCFYCKEKGHWARDCPKKKQ